MEVSRWKMLYGAITFIIGMFLFITIGASVQINYGMWGVVCTELGFLVFAVFTAWVGEHIFKRSQGLRKIFPLRAPRAYQWGGGLLFFLGAFFTTYTVSILWALAFPQAQEVSQDLGGFITGVSYFMAFITVSILPGICEEAWHRGTLYDCMTGVKSVAVRVIVMGIVFGLFHLDPMRFLPLAVFGAGLTYLRIKTDSLWIPMVCHALNNFISVNMAFLLVWVTGLIPEGSAAQTPVGLDATIIGIYACLLLFTISLAVLFLYLGARILNKKHRETIQVVYPAPQATQQQTYAQLPQMKQQIPLQAPLPQHPQPYVQQPYPAPHLAPPLPAPQKDTTRMRTILIVCLCSGFALLSCISCLIVSSLAGTSAL